MEKELLIHLPVVQAVAEQRGFAAAAAALNMSPSAVSHAVRAVEDRLGEPLFARTTRSVALTPAGARFIAQIGPALADINAAVEDLTAARGAITGSLRLNGPRIAVQMVIAPLLATLAKRHPLLTVELHTNDELVDIVADGFDAGIRLSSAISPDLVAVRISPPFQAVTVASPTYLQRHGEPKTLADLTAHNCIGFRFLTSGRLYEWEFSHEGLEQKLATRGTAVITDASFVRELALAGVGIGYVFEPLVRKELAEGSLLRVLPEWSVEEDGLFIYYPRRASLAPKLRAFIDVAKANVAKAEAL